MKRIKTDSGLQSFMKENTPYEHRQNFSRNDQVSEQSVIYLNNARRFTCAYHTYRASFSILE